MKNRKIILPIILTILAILLIVIAFIIPDKKDDKTINEVNENNSVVYRCILTIEEEKNTSYQIEELYVKDDTVLKSFPIMEIYYTDSDIYNSLKNDKEYSVGKEYNDEKLSVTFSNGDAKDMTKDINGNDMELKYSEYSKQLEKVGYTCKEK